MVLYLPKVAAVHDLSGFGRCALTVVIPTLSSLGISVLPVPTAVLSTHTLFKNPVFVDLTSHLPAFLEHWRSINLQVDCIYTGFLGSIEQISIVSGMIDTFATSETLVVVDPVMGDNGQLYSKMTTDFCKEMQKLVRKAKIITPNITEALLLLNKDPLIVPNTVEEIKTVLVELSNMGPEVVVITSALVNDFSISTFAYDRISHTFYQITAPLIPINYPGTGDCFASILVGYLLLDRDLAFALSKAVGFLSFAIEFSQKHYAPKIEGFLLEPCLSRLANDDDLPLVFII
ncbi:hypothetical protein RCL1_006413 [Eukaryota sp. TZLM3-RCL]